MTKKQATQTIREYNEDFLKTLEQLNPAQGDAVDQIEGPVLVIAGPGTGKTHILAARIGRILMETDTLPQNILCLTFTDAGVNAMRERLLSFIGPEAHRVHIYTFHSFCNTVIQENLELFGRHDMEPISELEQIELFRKLIDGLEHDHPIKGQRNDPYAFEKQLRDLMLRMKSENWSVEFIVEKVDTYLNDLPHRKDFIYQRKTKDFAKGDLKQWKIEDEERKMHRLKEAAKLYPVYIRMMRQMRRYDYADMILWVLKAFKENEVLLRTYQERYLYFLVDEYQDTNGSQNEIVKALISYWDSPNIFIVGDDDQSIFEFQGARLQNLLDFHQQHEDLNLVVLKDNYRSTQKVLDVSKVLIDHNQYRITNQVDGIDKNLEAKNENLSKSSIWPTVVEYPNRVQESVDIVFQIETLQKSGVPLNEIAIIYAQHRQAANILTLFDKKGIPYNTKRAVNILDLPNTQKLIQFLKYISEEQQQPFSGEPDLFRIMHFDFLNLPLNDLGRLSLFMAKHQYPDKKYWREVISEPILLQKIRVENPEAFQHFSKLINELIRGSVNLTILQLIERVINQSGLLQHLIQQTDKSWELQALNTFFDFIKKEADKNPRLTLVQLLETFKSLDANRVPIGIQKAIVANQGVNLVTAHSSKGLEFNYVFIIDAVKDFWEGKRRSSNQFSYPDTLTLSGEEDSIEARRRLFYVAMTRAQSFLNISYSKTNIDGKAIERAIFVDEILKEKAIKVEPRTTEESLILTSQLLQLQTIQRPFIPAQEKAIVDALLENFTMSISSLNRYLKCPLSFYYEDVLKIPSVQSEAASFGIAMHDALRRLFDKMRLSKTKQFPGLKDFLDFFEEEMQKLGAYFNTAEFDRRIQLGKIHLSTYYKQNIDTWSRTVFTEYNIKNIELDGVPLVGTIDRLDLIDSDKAHIVDYKTGSTDDKKLRKPSARELLGGLYWRQLVFYKIIFDLSQISRKVVSAEISYLEPDNKGNYLRKEIGIPVEEVEQVKTMIHSTYQKIKAHDFYEGCGEADCSWCGFVSLNQSRVSFGDRDGELLDD
jgi:ATP-dependent DNA helicase UvrD/PcrA